MTPSQHYISLVIPIFTRDSRMGEARTQIASFFSKWPQPIEVIFIVPSGGENAESQNAVAGSNAMARFVAHPRGRGVGAILAEGIRAASGKFIAISNVDLSAPLGDVVRAVTQLHAREDLDMVVGARVRTSTPKHFVEGSPRHSPWCLERYFQDWVSPYKELNPDPFCPFAVLRRESEILGNIMSRETQPLVFWSYGWAAEVLDLGGKVEKIPISWKYGAAKSVQSCGNLELIRFVGRRPK
jgi:hypothetical protein